MINPRCMSWRELDINKRVETTRIEAYTNFPQGFPVIIYLMVFVSLRIHSLQSYEVSQVRQLQCQSPLSGFSMEGQSGVSFTGGKPTNSHATVFRSLSVIVVSCKPDK